MMMRSAYFMKTFVRRRSSKIRNDQLNNFNILFIFFFGRFFIMRFRVGMVMVFGLMMLGCMVVLRLVVVLRLMVMMVY
jgi:hypothetical protein